MLALVPADRLVDAAGDAGRIAAARVVGDRRRARCAGRCVASAGFAAAISLGEFGATTFLTRSGDETLPIAIAPAARAAPATSHARRRSVLATMLAAVTVAILIAVEAPIVT